MLYSIAARLQESDTVCRHGRISFGLQEEIRGIYYVRDYSLTSAMSIAIIPARHSPTIRAPLAKKMAKCMYYTAIIGGGCDGPLFAWRRTRPPPRRDCEGATISKHWHQSRLIKSVAGRRTPFAPTAIAVGADTRNCFRNSRSQPRLQRIEHNPNVSINRGYIDYARSA